MSEIRIVRSEHLRFQRPIESERAERLKVFRERIKGEDITTVTEEAVIVSLTEPAYRIIDKPDGERRKIEWQNLFTKDHLHIDVMKFKDLIDAKKAAGLSITIKDAVYAYLLVFGYGRKSEIAGFLWAISDVYPEFRVKHEEVRTTIRVQPLTGPPRDEVRISRIAKQMTNVEELVSTVGQALSRLGAEGAIHG